MRYRLCDGNVHMERAGILPAVERIVHNVILAKNMNLSL